MQRIKYAYSLLGLQVEINDIYARKIKVHIVTVTEKKYCKIKRTDGKKMFFYFKSLQNAKRKVRKILKEEFEVNLKDEVRSVLCV